MSSHYLNEVLERADSPASIFICLILLVCLLAGLFRSGNNNQGDN